MIYLPSLSHWEYGNPWSGSCGHARYFIHSSGEEVTAEIWDGPFCYELSQDQIADSAKFPVSASGLAQLHTWLLDGTEQINQNYPDKNF